MAKAKGTEANTRIHMRDGSKRRVCRSCINAASKRFLMKSGG